MICALCGKKKLVANILGICRECILSDFPGAKEAIAEAHRKARAPFSLPAFTPDSSDGLSCKICSNECRFSNGQIGYCGLRGNSNGFQQKVSPDSALMYCYLDPHITNCCASWFCPAGTGCYYPRWAIQPGPEYGYFNLAVFYYGCNFNCLFCQNSSHKNLSEASKVSKEEFLSVLEQYPEITCICFFGGSPEPQLPFTVEICREIRRRYPSKLLRICLEWNGCGNSVLVQRLAEIVLQSGGIIKFDLKCFHEPLSLALSGVSNKKAYENFALLAREFYPRRPELPLLTATTLLVPGYVDEVEVESIAGWIAGINPEIPYSLLVFHPAFYMRDLPVTPRSAVYSAYRIARKYLRNVHIGNLHLLM